MTRYRPIESYAAIGDGRSVALVAAEGTLAWLCWPRFDSPSVFAALLDRDRGGFYAVRPAAEFEVRRGYVGETNVHEISFVTSRGELRLRDAMPVASEADKGTTMQPDHELLRIVECTAGEVEVEVIYAPRLDYGRTRLRLTDRGRLGIACQSGASMLALCSEIPLALQDGNATAGGRILLRAGERRRLSLVLGHGEPAIIAPLGDAADTRMERTLAWWREWAARCRYVGPYRDAVVRSALALKLLTFAPSGAVVAAATTSLPEAVGGERNWDYRFCWLRDASMTMRALDDLGYPNEARAFVSWLLHSTALSWPELQVVHDVYGEPRIPEKKLEHLEGWRGSRPVRVGNDARGQRQIDVYGEVIDAVYEFVRRGGTLDRSSARLLRGLARTAAKVWREPDEGIWEVRSGRRHHTHSKMMCWVAMDRTLQLAQRGELRAPEQELAATCEAIREEIERRGWNEELESYVSVFEGADVDASLLLLAKRGYARADSERMQTTCARIADRLGAGPLLYRYRGRDDGLPPGEGTFVICSFWMVTCLAQAGRIDEASALFEELLGYAGDAGLYPEEIDPDTGAGLGNTPQAFSHVGLIDAALTLEEAKASADPATRGAA